MRYPSFVNDTRAREVRAYWLAEKILDIADEGTNDTVNDNKGNEKVNCDVVLQSRLRVETRHGCRLGGSEAVGGQSADEE